MKVILLLTGLSAVLAAAPRDVKSRDFYVEPLEDGGFNLMVNTTKYGGDQTIQLGVIGRRARASDEGVTFELTEQEDEASGAWHVSVAWDGPADTVFEDCIDFQSRQWYGGPEQKKQYWPIQKSKLQKYSIISKEDDNAAVSERYWLNSAGQYIYVHPDSPLFVDYHNIMDNHICFVAEVTSPYSTKRTHNTLKYEFWFFDDPKEAHMHAVETYLGKPSGLPDYRMIQYPVWSTWARYSREIDQDNLWAFANEIKDSGFPNAQFEIDDLWEICYGSLTVDERKLPDFKKLVQDIKSLGFRVSIWAHPFINKDCDPWYSEALEKGYLVLNEDGSPDSSWWNNNGSTPGYVDFTNAEAAEWFASRLRTLIETYDIDSVKFDAGESSWSPQVPVQHGDIDLHPGHIVQSYVRTVAQFGPMIEVRSGMRTQDLPVFIRMVDKDTYWGFNNGLATLVTTLLAMNLNGYTLVLPDMIGGNGYNDRPGRELFARWLQANVFMPTLQYSFVPWDHDQEIVDICRRYTQLHADFADEIVAAMNASIRDGTPVNPPIWWIDPEDQVALAVWDGKEDFLTQDLPVFIRMVDKDTYWGFNNGLATLVTTLLAMNLNGYTLVLPDMIGGNGYNDRPGRELFARWLQANVFMPTLQYSFVPWDHDQEIVDICRRYTQLHADFADEIVAAMNASIRDGTPVNPPIWWIDPEDQVALAVWDEFLLGERILAAPVLEEGATSRDIYLPRGAWRDGVSGELVQGPTWLREYPAPLDTLPYFILEN